MARYDDLVIERQPGGREVYASVKACADVSQVEAFAVKGNCGDRMDVWVVPFTEVDGLRVYAQDSAQLLSLMLHRARNKHADELRSFARFIVSQLGFY